MESRRVANPKVLLPLAALAGLVFSAIAIFAAAGYSPDSGPRNVPADPDVTETSMVPLQPPPPPVMLPAPNPQVPCMGITAGGCEQLTPAR